MNLDEIIKRHDRAHGKAVMLDTYGPYIPIHFVSFQDVFYMEIMDC